jgi:hypothetical protein
MATPITGLDNVCIFNAYKLNFDELKSKGYKPILNVMDNQATKYIKKFLTKEECRLQLVNPTTIESMQPSELYRCSKMHSLLRL